MPKNIRKIATDIVKKLNSAGYTALFAGGGGREGGKGLETDDYENGTDARPGEIKGPFKKNGPGGARAGVVFGVIDNNSF